MELTGDREKVVHLLGVAGGGQWISKGRMSLILAMGVDRIDVALAALERSGQVTSTWRGNPPSGHRVYRLASRPAPEAQA